MAWRFAVLAVAASANSAAWAHEAGALEVLAPPGVSVRAPLVEDAGQGVRVSGAVCRNGFSSGRPRFVRFDRVNAFGAVTETRWSSVRGSPGYRGGCSFFQINAGALESGERARLSVHRSR